MKLIFGDRQAKEMKDLQPLLDAVSEVYQTLQNISDEDVKEKVNDIKNDIHAQLAPFEQQVKDLDKKYQTEHHEKKKDAIGDELDKANELLKQNTQKVLDNYLPDVFAIVKDTCRRLNGYKYDVRGHEEEWFMVPYNVQLIGGWALHNGKIAEMATGEGKTLAATLPMFLNALTSRGVHLITVNDYLAHRDREWMKPIFDFHAMDSGVIYTGMSQDDRRAAYRCAITYGTNSEFGFDYLRDNMVVSSNQLAQRKLNYAIIDEVDSILIDEARTPLIISGSVAESKNFYKELKPKIIELMQAQTMLVSRLLREARPLIENTDSDSNELGRILLIIKRGAPKNNGFVKMMKDPVLVKLVADVESLYGRDKKMSEIDEELFFVIDEHSSSVDLSEQGRDMIHASEPNLYMMDRLDELLDAVDKKDISFKEKAAEKEQVTTLFLDKNEKLHNISQLLKSYSLFEKEKDYIIQNQKVIIVDEFTGRPMPGRRFSDGLHQALEAKENVKIEDASQTVATITFQNYFRMYGKLSGMTGTAITEENEFMEIYNLSVMQIPTHEPIARHDHDDLIFMTKNEKYKAIIKEIEYWHALGKPVLVGTTTVDVSEVLSKLLSRKKITHNVLNAKQHAREAEVVANAGQPGAVTIATNMAGRGTDIKLGEGVVTGRDKAIYLEKKSIDISESLEYGGPTDGLHVIGTERHESRRIDRQLRGRAGRQGDPGTSRFYLSLEDNLMRLFGSDRIAPMLSKIGLQPDEAIMHPWMSSAVEKAQKRVELHNFEIRKQLLKYDEIMNMQRNVIYNYRQNVLKGYDLRHEIMEMMHDSLENLLDLTIEDDKYQEEWQLGRIVEWLEIMGIRMLEEQLLSERTSRQSILETVDKVLIEAYASREEYQGREVQRDLERYVLLSVVDEEWREHLREMDILKDGIGMRQYANKDPLIEYKKEGFTLFQALINRINEKVTQKVFTTFLVTNDSPRSQVRINEQHGGVTAYHGDSNTAAKELEKTLPRRVENKPKRNDLCPCGSNKKYKHCCGKHE